MCSYWFILNNKSHLATMWSRAIDVCPVLVLFLCKLWGHRWPDIRELLWIIWQMVLQVIANSTRRSDCTLTGVRVVHGVLVEVITALYVRRIHGRIAEVGVVMHVSQFVMNCVMTASRWQCTETAACTFKLKQVLTLHRKIHKILCTESFITKQSL